MPAKKNALKNLFQILLLAAILPLSARAQSNPQDSPIKGMDDIFRILNDIVRWVYIIFFIITVLYVILAAFSFLTSEGDPEKAKSATKQIFYAAIAVAIALISVAFSFIIDTFLRNGA